MTKTISIAQAQEELPEIVRKAKKRLNEYIITLNGKPSAVLMSIDEYNAWDSWKETQEILNDPELTEAIREGKADIAAGRLYDWEDVKKELGLDTKKEYVSNKTYKSSKTRA